MGDYVNIGAGNAGDAFYRYKMPKLQSKVEGRGNGVKTNVMNCVEVSRALGRPPALTTKYFGCTLGAQSRFNEESGQSIVNGSFHTSELVSTLEGFIKTFVQCYKCGNPETVMEVDKRENITMTCKACGHVSTVPPNHKLCTFILKNPPKKKKKDKKDKALDKLEKKKSKKEKKDKERDGDDDKKEKKRKKKEKKERERLEAEKAARDASPSPPGGSPGADGDDDDDDDDDDGVQWTSDTSADAVAKRLASQNLSDNFQGEGAPAADAAPEAPAAEAADAAPQKPTAAEIVAMVRAKIAEKAKPVDTAKELFHLADTAEEGVRLLVEAILGEVDGKEFERTLTKARKYLKVVNTTEAKQMSIVCALEHFLAAVKPAECKNVGFGLKVFYEEDIVEEEIINAWYAQPGAAASMGVAADAAAKVRKFAAPFMDWMNAPESDSD